MLALRCMLPGAAIHEGSTADLDTVAKVLDDALRVLARADVPCLLIGGIANSLLGRPRCTSDIDLLVAPEHARHALRLLADDGFETEETNPHWLFKAFRDDVLVDLLFKSCGDVYLDGEMLARGSTATFRGTPVRIVSPEDLIVIKAIAHCEETPRHWHDALALLTRPGLDWTYLLQRSRKGPVRMLSLLAYAVSIGISVPAGVRRALAEDMM